MGKLYICIFKCPRHMPHHIISHVTKLVDFHLLETVLLLRSDAWARLVLTVRNEHYERAHVKSFLTV